MKNKFIIMISSLLCVLCISCSDYVHNMYDDDDVVMEQISYKQGMQDVRGLCLLIKTSYAGYNALFSNGYNEKIIIKNYRSQFKGRRVIQCQELYDFLYENLCSFIQDTHFSLRYDDSYKEVVDKVKPFFSNTYVSKKTGRFVVIESDVFEKGSILMIDNDKLFPVIKNNEMCYRIGLLSGSAEQSLDVEIVLNDKSLKVECNSSTNSFKKDYFSLETENSMYLNVAPFFEYEIQDEEFFSKLLDGVKKDNLIIDIRNNRGGDGYVVSKVLYTICSKGMDYESPNYKDFISCFDSNQKIVLSKYTRNWFKALSEYFGEDSIEYSDIKKILSSKSKYYISNGSKKDATPDNEYTGHVYLLTSKATASSSEDLIGDVKKIFPRTQYTIIGTNTAGALRYGNVFDYCLNNSGICVSFGCTDFSADDLPEEGKGYEPDYWCDDNDVYEVLEALTHDKDLYGKIIKYE